MESWNQVLTDWVNLPPESSVQSLWVCLHDTELTRIESDLRGRYVVVEVQAFFMPENVRVLLRLDEVKSVRVNRYPPPHQSLLSEGMSWQERNRVGEEWVSKWREESMSWEEFVRALPTDPLEVAEADIAAGDGHLTLRVGGHLNGEKYDDLWCAVFLRAGSISASRSDGQDFSLERFIEAGGQWWESFGSRQA